jgi:hypothetical protein
LSEKDEQMSTTAREKKYCSKKTKRKRIFKAFPTHKHRYTNLISGIAY